MSENTRVKICGVTTTADALMAAHAGADLLGLNFYPPSPRFISVALARETGERLREELSDRCPLLVGVFVNEEPARVADICLQAGLDGAQLSGDESPDDLHATSRAGAQVFKSLRPRTVAEARAGTQQFLAPRSGDEGLPSLLLDAWHPDLYGGSGEQAGDDVAGFLAASVPRLMLAGGLNAENVAGRVRALRPWGVDVASGVESAPGIKDERKVRAFIAAAKGRL